MTDEIARWAKIPDGEEEWVRFVTELRPRLFRFIERFSRRYDLAEEITQDVFVTIYIDRKRFDPSRGDVLRWCYIIARNKTFDWLRIMRKENQESSNVAVVHANEAHSNEIQNALFSKLGEIDAAVPKLPRWLQNFMKLYYDYIQSRLTETEFAELNGLSRSQWFSRKKKAFAQLKAILEREHTHEQTLSR